MLAKILSVFPPSSHNVNESQSNPNSSLVQAARWHQYVAVDVPQTLAG